MSARRAFTLTELLCVVAIIAILVGLTLPATRRVREAAARSKCQNNLKQLALAAHLYADTHYYLPPATVPNPELAPDQRLSWHAAVLPYVEQKALFDALDLTAPWDAPANAAAVRDRRVPLFQCPSVFVGERSDAAVTTSVGVAGLGADAAGLPAADPRAGVFGYDRRLKIAEIRDGASNTALVMEATTDLGPWVRGGPATVRGVTGDVPLVAHEGDRRYAWEDRPRGSNVALADGSVRYLPDRTPPAVWAALATLAGGERMTNDQ